MAPQRGGGCIFKSYDISLKSTPTSPVISLTPYLCTHCNASSHALTYAIIRNGVCLHFLVPPVVSLMVIGNFSLNINCMHCSINRWACFRMKSTPLNK